MSEKAVMIAIHPEWVEKIMSGEKTVEIRKSVPNLTPPYKCYVYRTLPKRGGWTERDGRVVGEFICNGLDDLIMAPSPESGIPYLRCNGDFATLDYLRSTQLTQMQMLDYIGSCGKRFFGMHISDVKRYANPLSVTEFRKAGGCEYSSEGGCEYPYFCYRAGQQVRCSEAIHRPPQSWMYVDPLSSSFGPNAEE